MSLWSLLPAVQPELLSAPGHQSSELLLLPVEVLLLLLLPLILLYIKNASFSHVEYLGPREIMLIEISSAKFFVCSSNSLVFPSRNRLCVP